MLWVRDYNKNTNVHFRSNVILDFTEGFNPVTDKVMSQNFRVFVVVVVVICLFCFFFSREGEREKGGERQSKREREDLRKTPRPVWSLMRGSLSQS